MGAPRQPAHRGGTSRLELAVASLLLNVGTLFALVTWLTTNRFELFANVSNEQVRMVLSTLVVGLPVTLVSLGGQRLSQRIPAELGLTSLLSLAAPISALFTLAAVLHALLPLDATLAHPARAVINIGTLVVLARIILRRARRAPDWLSIAGGVFAVGLLPLATLSLLAQSFQEWRNWQELSQVPSAQVVLSAVFLIYLVALVPSLFFGRAMAGTEALRYRPVEQKFVNVIATFGTGALAAILIPIATSQLYGSLNLGMSDLPYVQPPGEWVVIGLLAAATAWRLVREAERRQQPLLWIGAIPPVITTTIAINWYLPAELGGLPVAGALIALGGLVLLRRGMMVGPRSRRPVKRR